MKKCEIFVFVMFAFVGCIMNINSLRPKTVYTVNIEVFTNSQKKPSVKVHKPGDPIIVKY